MSVLYVEDMHNQYNDTVLTQAGVAVVWWTNETIRQASETFPLNQTEVCAENMVSYYAVMTIIFADMTLLPACKNDHAVNRRTCASSVRSGQ